MMTVFRMTYQQDEDAGVWCGTVENPAVAADAPTLSELVKKVTAMVADLTGLAPDAVTLVMSRVGSYR
jgi:hypothetical protein